MYSLPPRPTPNLIHVPFYIHHKRPSLLISEPFQSQTKQKQILYKMQVPTGERQKQNKKKR